ncbi:MAG: L,D-transpeptidase family protein [Flavobacteriaceae bacterium]
MSFKKVLPSLLLASALLALPACVSDSRAPKHLKPIPPQLMSLMEERSMLKSDPILIRIFKEESALEVWKKDRTGRYALLKAYNICAWSGVLGPKVKEGDRQAPEGFYTITPALMNPNSSYYLSFNIGYPNQFDKALNRTGSHLMVHGACSSSGCYSMEDEQIGEIYSLAREAFKGGQRAFQVQAMPFRMTPENLARHRNNPNMAFWKNLKEGSDHFEVTGLPPEVGVCGRHYVFNVEPDNPRAKLDPIATCPTLKMPEELRIAVAEKEAKDEADTKVAVAALLSKPAYTPAPAPAVMLATSEPGPSEPVYTAAAVSVPDAPPAPEMETAAAPPQAKPESGSSFFSRAVAAANPRGWFGGSGGSAQQPVPALAPAADVPVPAARPQRSAFAASGALSGYAPARALDPRDGDPFAVFDLFVRVGEKSWAPRDSRQVRQRGQ